MTLTLKIRTLTPLWTGGIDRDSSRPRETGLLGSLRWWYEAIVRGLGGYVSDPTSRDAAQRAEFDTKAYSRALKDGRSREHALVEGLKPLGAVEYLFGATGWSRLFRLQVLNAPRVPLHFCTTLDINKNWLGRIFQGKEDQNYAIDDLKVLYGDLEFQIALRGYDVAYAQEQIAFLFRFVEAFGGLGAKLQHGFGQVGNLTLPDEMEHMTLESGFRVLKEKLNAGPLRRSGPVETTPYSLTNFFHQVYRLPDSTVHRFTRADAHFGNSQQSDETAYLPCAFDLRYKGDGNLGLRRWLRDEKDWQESDDPSQLGPLDELLGPRSEWEDARGRKVSIKDECRTASRVYFGMPTEVENGYQLVIFGFVPPTLSLSVEDLRDLCSEYMHMALGVRPTKQTLGKDLIDRATGGAT